MGRIARVAAKFRGPLGSDIAGNGFFVQGHMLADVKCCSGSMDNVFGEVDE